MLVKLMKLLFSQASVGNKVGFGLFFCIFLLILAKLTFSNET